MLAASAVTALMGSLCHHTAVSHSVPRPATQAVIGNTSGPCGTVSGFIGKHKKLGLKTRATQCEASRFKHPLLIKYRNLK